MPSSITIDQALALAAGHVAMQQWPQAEAMYREILRQHPDDPDALHGLALLAAGAGRADVAIELLRRAAAVHPGHAAAWDALAPLLGQSGDLDGAMAAARRAIALLPERAQGYYNLGLALQARGEPAEAAEAYRGALRLMPDWPEAHQNLAVALIGMGDSPAALPHAARAVALRPGWVEARIIFADALLETGRAAEAAEAYERLLPLRPADPHLRDNLASALRALGRLDDAIARYREALALDPNRARTLSNLATVLKDDGDVPGAIDAYRRAVALEPGSAEIHSNLVYSLYFDPALPPEAIRREEAEWARRHAEPLRASIRGHDNDRAPGRRRLRVGYVSPDFYLQAECHFVLPLLEAHDRAQVEVHCYSSVARPDAITERYRRTADGWHEVRDLSDEKLAAKVRDDRIDILVDLTMHMRYSRLGAFARKPAPVQVTWLAYPGSTGLATVDYRLSDGHMDPPTPEVDASYAERSVRLPDSWCCYDPITPLPPVGPLPAAGRGGRITFGCLNNVCKLNPRVLELWARVLRRVEGEASLLLLLLAPEGKCRDRLRGQLDGLGIDGGRRVDFVTPGDRGQYLRYYDRVDICLDPFPYNGITTTCDALWMGVPVLTLAGGSAPARAGASLLTTAGLPEWIAGSADQFVEKAASLAADVPALARTRAGLRDFVSRSRLADARLFAGSVERAYRAMWADWVITAGHDAAAAAPGAPPP